jgi:hypothetical protein
MTRRWGSDLAAAFCVGSHSASPWAGDAAEKLIMTASCGRRPVVDGQAGEQYASLTRLGLPVAVKALAGVRLRGAARYETRDTECTSTFSTEWGGSGFSQVRVSSTAAPGVS